jgi:hypothetical protein
MFVRKRIVVSVEVETLEGLEALLDRAAEGLRERVAFEAATLLRGTDADVVGEPSVRLFDDIDALDPEAADLLARLDRWNAGEAVDL